MKLTNSIWLLVFTMLVAAGPLQAALPALPEIPTTLSGEVRQTLNFKRAPLAQRQLALIEQGEAIKQSCTNMEKGSSQHQSCLTKETQFNADVQTLRVEMGKFADEIDIAVNAEIKQLQVQHQKLSQSIDNDLRMIRSLGFNRRAEDFAEWEKLATDAKTDFESEVRAAVTDAIVSEAQDKLLATFKGFDKAKAREWIAALEQNNPPPVELIATIRRLSQVQSKEQIVRDAEFILKSIEHVEGVAGSKTRTEGVTVLVQDIVCDMSPAPLDKQCKLLQTETKLTIAALFNNATRRVAVHEVERLTTMTEDQLRGLTKISELMARHVHERNEVRTKLKELE